MELYVVPARDRNTVWPIDTCKKREGCPHAVAWVPRMPEHGMQCKIELEDDRRRLETVLRSSKRGLGIVSSTGTLCRSPMDRGRCVDNSKADDSD